MPEPEASRDPRPDLSAELSTMRRHLRGALAALEDALAKIGQAAN